jgi:hypothetical protein
VNDNDIIHPIPYIHWGFAMEFKVELSINNKLKTARKSTPYSGRKQTDGIGQKERTRKAEAALGYLHAQKALSRARPVDTGNGRWDSRADGVQLSCVGQPTLVNPHLVYIPSIKNIVSVSEQLPSGRWLTEDIDADELVDGARRRLDIYKKLRQKTHRRGGWGSPSAEKSFSGYARHSILEAGAVVDRLYPLAATRMITCTIPGSTDAALRAVALYSGWIIDRLFRPIRRHKLPDGSPALDWFFVWEFQGRGALHIHICLASNDADLTRKCADQVAFDWFELLLEIKGKNGVDCFERYHGGTWRSKPSQWKFDNQVCRKSVAAYFSKYASKEYKNEGREKTAKAYGMHFPSRFWGSSSNIKKVAHSFRVKVVFGDLNKRQCQWLHDNFYELISGWKPVIKSEFEYIIEVTSKSSDFRWHAPLSLLHETEREYAMHQPIASGIVTVSYYEKNDFQELYETMNILLGSYQERKVRDTVLHRIADSCLLTFA